MNAKMKEACLAVAEIFEAIPECWTAGAQGRDSRGVSLDGDDPKAERWCAIGGVLAAMDGNGDAPDPVGEIAHGLQPFATQLGYSYASAANNEGGRLVAIKMLRMAGAA